MDHSRNTNIRKKRTEDDDRKAAEIILAHMKLYHNGRDNAVSYRVLYDEMRWKIGDLCMRRMRRVMSEHLRDRGFCSSSSAGYWYSEAREDKEASVAFLRSYGLHSLAGASRIKKTIGGGSQMGLF